MRILWVSNAPWAATGYGNQTGLLAPRLRALGHDVAVFAFYGLDGAIIQMDGMTIYPGGLLQFGNDLLRQHARQHHADLVISFMDVWVQEYWGRRLAEEGIAFAPWTPIDQSPAPPAIVDRLDQATVTVAMADFGRRELEAAGVRPVTLIPCAVDTTVYRPINQAQARRQVGLPEDAFIVGMVAKNTGSPSRKCFTEQFLAFSRFARKRSDAVLYVHTVCSVYDHGMDLEALAKSCGLEAGKNIVWADQYRYQLGYEAARMAALYNAFDLLSAASMGEGFGIPIIEAQACGTPVVTTNCTSMPELTGSGWVVRKTHPFWTALQGWTQSPDVEELEEIYSGAYDQRRTGEYWPAKVRAARHHALTYDVSEIVREGWAPLLASIEEARRGNG